MAKGKSRLIVIKQYFELDNKAMIAEKKKLSEADIQELAVGAAKALKLKPEDCNFDLK